MKLSDLTAKTKAITMPYGNDELHMVVNVSVLTPKMAAESARLGQPSTDPDVIQEQMAALSSMVSKLVASWDLEDQGEPYPITPEALGDLPIDFLAAVSRAVSASMGEASAPESGANSGATS